MADAKPTKRSKPVKDLHGKIFGRLTVISLDPERDGNGKTRWRCLCACGNSTTVLGSNLVRGLTTSCKCYRTECQTKHGMYGTKEYVAWIEAKARCFNPNCHEFHNYQGRGISMDPRWVNSF